MKFQLDWEEEHMLIVLLLCAIRLTIVQALLPDTT